MILIELFPYVTIIVLNTLILTKTLKASRFRRAFVPGHSTEYTRASSISGPEANNVRRYSGVPRRVSQMTECLPLCQMGAGEGGAAATGGGGGSGGGSSPNRPIVVAETVLLTTERETANLAAADKICRDDEDRTVTAADSSSDASANLTKSPSCSDSGVDDEEVVEETVTCTKAPPPVVKKQKQRLRDVKSVPTVETEGESRPIGK